MVARERDQGGVALHSTTLGCTLAAEELQDAIVAAFEEALTTDVSDPLNFPRGETLVHLEAAVELAGVASLLAPLAGRTVRRGVNDNLAVLKSTLEMGATSF